MDVYRLGVLALLLASAGAAFAAQNSLADELADAGQRTFAEKRFPWFDTASNSLSEMKQAVPDRAKTLNRAELPVYKPRQQTATRARNPIAPNYGSSFLNTMIWIAIGIVFALIVGALVWFFMKMEGRTGLDSRSHEEETVSARARIKQLPFEVPDDSNADFHELAARAAAQGNYGQATILLFSHVLLYLDQKGLIRLKKGKTNRQYLRELQSHSHLSNYFQRVMVPFEDAFFGDHLIQKPVFDANWNDLDGFQDRVNQSLQAEP